MSKPATETRALDIVFPRQTNHYGTLFAGDELALLAKIAFIAATRHARARLVLRGSENVEFLAPAPQGRLIELIGRVVETGASSIIVEAELVAEDLLAGDRKTCVTGRFTLVAVDKRGRAARLGARPDDGDA